MTTPPAANPQVVMETSEGSVTIELFEKDAPLTVANFLSYVDAAFYDGVIFQRVMDIFMIQGGGYTGDMTQKPTRAPVKNVAHNGVKNARGALAMARTSDPHSATAQFFINVKDNDFLDFTAKTAQGYGYCVFGKVAEGMDVVDRIRATRTGRKGQFSDVPVKPIVIKSIRRA